MEETKQENSEPYVPFDSPQIPKERKFVIYQLVPILVVALMIPVTLLALNQPQTTKQQAQTIEVPTSTWAPTATLTPVPSITINPSH